jgi:addiction module HigA family antidote
MPDHGLSVAGLAGALGVSRQTVNELLRERRALSPEMALRLARLFGNGPDFWLKAQQALDLWEAEQSVGDEVGRIRPLRTADRSQKVIVAGPLGLDGKGLADFCERRGVSELAVFGSALRDDYGAASDIDVLVAFTSGAKVPLFDLVNMADELTSMFDRRVDLVPKEGLKPYIRRSILESAQVIYAAHDVLYLVDMVEAAEAIESFLARLEILDSNGIER